MGRRITPSGRHNAKRSPATVNPASPVSDVLPIYSSAQNIIDKRRSENSVISIPDTAYITKGPDVAKTRSGSIIWSGGISRRLKRNHSMMRLSIPRIMPTYGVAVGKWKPIL